MEFWYHSHRDYYKESLTLTSTGSFTTINLSASHSSTYTAGDKYFSYTAYYPMYGTLSFNGQVLFSFSILPKTTEVFAHTPPAGSGTYEVVTWDNNTATDGGEQVILFVSISEYLK